MKNLAPLGLAFGMLTSTLASPALAGPLESVYTELTAAKCKLVKEDVEYQEEKCPGVGGYSLLSIYSDQRQSITVVTPQGKEHPLNYWEVITPAMSHLGDKAEWRIVKEGGKSQPKALIVRVTTAPHLQKELKASYLAVAKIGDDAICVTDRIEPGPKANELARQAADSAAAKPCLKAKP
ncbi:MAG TPA: hypothetical protein VJR29_06760 [bacterium]|nr:hypothetical protein [bacterium]